MESRSMLGTAEPVNRDDENMRGLKAVADFYAQELREKQNEQQLRELQSEIAGMAEEDHLYPVLGLIPDEFEEDFELVALYDSGSDDFYLSEDFCEQYDDVMESLPDTLEDYGPVQMARNVSEPEVGIDPEIGVEVAYRIGDNIRELSDEVLEGNRGTYIVPVEPEPM